MNRNLRSVRSRRSRVYGRWSPTSASVMTRPGRSCKRYEHSRVTVKKQPFAPDEQRHGADVRLCRSLGLRHHSVQEREPTVGLRTAPPPLLAGWSDSPTRRGMNSRRASPRSTGVRGHLSSHPRTIWETERVEVQLWFDLGGIEVFPHTWTVRVRQHPVDRNDRFRLRVLELLLPLHEVFHRW